MIRRRGADSAIFAGAALAGLAGAFLLARHRHRSHRSNLFSSRPTRRFAALGWLEHQGDPASLPLLRDYLAWEAVPLLQRRARRLVSLLETSGR